MTRKWTNSRFESLTGSQVKALLRVASGARPPSEEAQKPDVAEVEQLLGEMSRVHGEGANTGLLEVAMAAGTAVSELVRIKDLAKVLIEGAPDNRHREAARLLYHVAVATAFVHHGKSISGRPMLKQQVVYEQLTMTWTGHAIGRLFREAAARVSTPIPPE